MTGLEVDFALRRGEFTLELALDIAPGETVALLGPNAAGKSTAVAAICGLLPVDSGRISLAGAVVDDPALGLFVPPERRHVGVVFQDGLLFPHLTVAENVEFGARSAAARTSARAWLSRVGLEGIGDRRPGELSGGQAQRVALARALATEPSLLLLDEPLSALDVRTRGETRQVLAAHLAGFAGPRLLITHEPAEAFLLADRICILEAGRVTQFGAVADVRSRPRTAYAAELADINLLRGVAGGGSVDLEGHTLSIADRAVQGPVVVSVRPSSVGVHTTRPQGSPRNVWETAIESLEAHGDRIRLRTGAPLALVVEITGESARVLDLIPGRRVWVSVKATDVAVEPG